MDQDTFISAYLGGLVGLLSPLGYDGVKVKDALWASTRAMMTNNGEITNEERFWQSFSAVLGDDVRNHESALNEFYMGEFQKIKNVCGYTPRAREIIDLAKQSGVRVILATSPLFPGVATESRIGWAGLNPDDFEYVTTYENSRYCKPNPVYYTNLISELGLAPEECVMIGNDVGDDMVAETVGMKVFLLTDCLINKAERELSDFPHGDFDALEKYLEEML